MPRPFACHPGVVPRSRRPTLTACPNISDHLGLSWSRSSLEISHKFPYCSRLLFEPVCPSPRHPFRGFVRGRTPTCGVEGYLSEIGQDAHFHNQRAHFLPFREQK